MRWVLLLIFSGLFVLCFASGMYVPASIFAFGLGFTAGMDMTNE